MTDNSLDREKLREEIERRIRYDFPESIGLSAAKIISGRVYDILESKGFFNTKKVNFELSEEEENKILDEANYYDYEDERFTQRVVARRTAKYLSEREGKKLGNCREAVSVLQADSKKVCGHSHVGSTPTTTAQIFNCWECKFEGCHYWDTSNTSEVIVKTKGICYALEEKQEPESKGDSNE